MKRLLVALLLVIAMGQLQAQYEAPSTLKIGAGYTHDFPGLNGYTIAGEYIFPLSNQLQGGIGLKYADMEGYPRTNQVNEFTKAKTLDFNLYWVPLQTDDQLFRIGIGYAFSFYDIKRSYPLLVDNNSGNKTTTWPTQMSTGRTAGISVIAEYEYKLPNTPVSIGVRGALYKAYDRVFFIGPMMGLQF